VAIFCSSNMDMKIEQKLIYGLPSNFNIFYILFFHISFSRSSSEGDLFFMIQKLVLVIIFTFFAGYSLNIIVIFIYCISGLVLYTMVRKNIYYYNPYIYKVVCGQHFLTFWTGLILLLSKVFHFFSFFFKFFCFILDFEWDKF